MAGYYEWAPYVPVAERRRKAEKAMEKQRKRGVPVVITGRTIARTFWGRAWCDNLERYSDFANRLPRGRTYVRNGSVIDLQITPGLVQAQVSGSRVYRVRVEVKAVPGPQWQAVCTDCGGAVASLVELLQGRFNRGVMERLCRQGAGLFPAPKEIVFSCSCPDSACMCKHVAAVLYGVGARLDTEPELLFLLRRVDGKDLLAQAAAGLASAPPALEPGRVLEGEDLAELFGLDLGAGAPAAAVPPPAATRVVKVRARRAGVSRPAPDTPGGSTGRAERPKAGGGKRAAAKAPAVGKRGAGKPRQPSGPKASTGKPEPAAGSRTAAGKPGKGSAGKSRRAVPKAKGRSGVLR